MSDIVIKAENLGKNYTMGHQTQKGGYVALGSCWSQRPSPIRQMKGQRTIILIAHRLTTVRECDVIFLLEQGKVVGQGTFEELERTNLEFHRMARGTSRVHDQ